MISRIALLIKGVVAFIESMSKVFFFSNFHPQLGRVFLDISKPSVVLGNGPSLASTLLTFSSFFSNKNVICVNDFAASNQFEKVKPVIYVLTDPTFWSTEASTRIKDQINEYKRKIIKSVHWNMTIILPFAAKKWNYFQEIPNKNKHVNICYINTTEISCPKKLRFYLYKKNFAIPTMQNVIIAALYVSINVGIKTIYLVGADHSWHESFFVGNDNVLYLKNKRFDDKEEIKFSPFFQDPAERTPYRMDNLLFALARMFQGYCELDDYSKYRKSKIFNASTKSYIDAFERYRLKNE